MNFHTRKWVKPGDLNPNGTLFGGSASCSYKQGTDNFGRLSVGFSNGMNRWLVAKDPSAL